MQRLAGRARARLSQSWKAYGGSVAVGNDLVRAVGHSARSNLSTALLSVDLRRRLRHPNERDLTPQLQHALALLPELDAEATTWLVHRRPSGRSIVHEIDRSGRLISVVKIGSPRDPKLMREHRVLSLLADRSSQDPIPVLPTLLGAADDQSLYALRTRLDLSGLAPPPYRWSTEFVSAAGVAITLLHERMSAAGSQTVWETPLAATTDESVRRPGVLVPSHGDLTAWNLFLLHVSGDLVLGLIDFEDAGLWPSWWDSARLVATGWDERRVSTARLPEIARALGVTRNDLVEYSTIRQCLDDPQGPRRMQRSPTSPPWFDGSSWE